MTNDPHAVVRLLRETLRQARRATNTGATDVRKEIDAALAVADALLAAPVEQFAWVVEHGTSPVSAPRYWAAGQVDPTRSSAWTENHEHAIRFARRLDAERVAERTMQGIAVRICEHGWTADALVAEPVEPVAWQWRYRAIREDGIICEWNEWQDGRAAKFNNPAHYQTEERPLYAHPPTYTDRAAYERGVRDALETVDALTINDLSDDWLDRQVTFAGVTDLVMDKLRALIAKPAPDGGTDAG